METFFEKWLPKLKFLNIGDPQLLAEFASHAGWSLAFLFIIEQIFGDRGLVPGALVVIGYGVLKECFEDGHLLRILKGTEPADEFKDFVTDLLSRTAAPVLFLAFRFLH